MVWQTESITIKLLPLWGTDEAEEQVFLFSSLQTKNFPKESLLCLSVTGVNTTPWWSEWAAGGPTVSTYEPRASCPFKQMRQCLIQKFTHGFKMSVSVTFNDWLLACVAAYCMDSWQSGLYKQWPPLAKFRMTWSACHWHKAHRYLSAGVIWFCYWSTDLLSHVLKRRFAIFNQLCMS